MRYFSSFAGVEGFGLGLPEDECVGFSEYDKYCSAVLRHLYPQIKNYGDITKIDWSGVPDFDLFVGGSPCQDLSVAGKRAGLAGKRSGLFHEYVRALREKRPDYFIWENVGGAFSSQGGWDLARVQLDLAESGYALWWNVLDAQYFDTPQERHRVFIVGSRKGSPPPVLFQQEDDRGDIAPECEAGTPSKSLTTIAQRQDTTSQTYVAHALDTRQSVPSSTQSRKVENFVAQTLDTRKGGDHLESSTLVAHTLKARADSSVDARHPQTLIARTLRTNAQSSSDSNHPQTLIAQNQRNEVRRRKISGPSGSLTASQSSKQFQAVETGIGIRRFTPLESERIMGWPDNHTKYGVNDKGERILISDAQRYKMCGNGVCPRVVAAVRKHLII